MSRIDLTFSFINPCDYLNAFEIKLKTEIHHALQKGGLCDTDDILNACNLDDYNVFCRHDMVDKEDEDTILVTVKTWVISQAWV